MSARSTQIFLHNETDFTLSKIEEDLPHGIWGHDGGQRPPQAIAPRSVAEMGSDSSGVATGTEGSVRYRIEDGEQSTVYFHWNNPFSGSNGYHQFTDYDFHVFHTGGDDNNAVVSVFLRPSMLRDARGFRPSTHGFRFGNSWGELPYSLPPLKESVLDFKYGNAKNGLCGGMISAVRDYFEAGVPIPRVNLPPPGEQDPLFNYIVERLFDTFDVDDVSLYLKLMDPLYPDTDENVLNPVGLANGRAFVMANIEWPLIQQDIDSGHPSPLGLVLVKSLLPFDLGKNHQVLAYAYQVHGNDVELWVYDPNQPEQDSITLKFNIRTTAERIDVAHNVGAFDENNTRRPVYCFFRTNYSFKQPPAAPFQRSRQPAGTAVARRPEHLDVFWLGSDGAIGSTAWDAHADDAQWLAPYPITPPGAARARSAVAAISRFPDHLDIFWPGPDGAIGSTAWDAHADDAQWLTPYPVTPPNAARADSPITAVAGTPDHLDVFWIGPDGAIGSTAWDAFANDARWLTPYPITPPDAVRPDSPITAVTRKPEHLDVFWIGPDGAIGSTAWDAHADNAQWLTPYPITPPGAARDGSPITVVARTPDHLDVFWIGPDGAIGSTAWDAYADDARWLTPYPITPPNAARIESPLSVVARMQEQMDVFWTGPDGAIGSTFWNAHINNAGWNPPFPITPPGAAG